MDFAVWNTLHDGSITAITGDVPGDVTVQIDIAYLCAKLPTKAEHVTVRLRGCIQFVFEPHGEPPTTDLAEIASNDIEVLSASEHDHAVSVECIKGRLELIYKHAETFLAEGTPISQSELEAAADRYWKEWSQKHGVK